jgi:hypothetical protein
MKMVYLNFEFRRRKRRRRRRRRKINRRTKLVEL